MSGSHVPVALQGVPQATLQLWLADAQQAMHALNTGRREVEVAYGQGDGQKSVKYNMASLPQLRIYIQQLQTALGLVSPRRAISLNAAGRRW